MMKKSNPFVAIPTVPTTVSGQWLTFSHMANHYRKLLNVKPRVQSNAPSRRSSFGTSPTTTALSASPKKLPKKQNFSTNEVQPDSKSLEKKRKKPIGNYNESEKSGVSLTVVKRKGPAKVKSYQIIFDQSELNNLSEAVMSDSEVEVDEPNVRPMGISEKIRLYLDQLEDPATYENSQSNSFISAYTSDNGVITPPKELRGKSKTKTKPIDMRMSRHSQCFVPYVPDAPSPRGSGKVTSNGKIPNLRIVSKPKVTTLAPAQKPKQHVPIVLKSENPIYLKRPESKISAMITKSEPIKSLQNKKDKKTKSTKSQTLKKKATKEGDCCSPNSGSIGTIRGSDELTRGDRYLSLVSESNSRHLTSNNKINRKFSTKSINDPCFQSQELESILSLVQVHGLSSDWLTETQPVRLNKSAKSNQKSAKKSLTSTLGLVVTNKDSSRDSAYGFSSGESKITTRESTPEKRKVRKRVQMDTIGQQKYKSNLSTVPSSINQDSLGEYETNNNQSAQTRHKIKHDSTDWLSDDRYINFITAVTDDIVKREVYTNKGVKSIFQSHIDANMDLQMDKMVYMLDRLRMDVGVPKEDSLNQMEFGYGSIKYATGPFFYKLGQLFPTIDVNSSGGQSIPAQNIASGQTLSTKGSDVTIFELHHRRPPSEFHSADESSKMSSCSESICFENDNQSPIYKNRSIPCNIESDNQSQNSNPQSSKSSDDSSVTESQLRLALGQVGFNTEVTKDIVQTVTEGQRRRRLRKKNIDTTNSVEPNNNFVSGETSQNFQR